MECIVDFSSLEIQEGCPTLHASGNTPMGEAMNLGLELLKKRKNEYKERGVDYYQPWIVLMTDGGPNGDENKLQRAISRTVELVSEKKLTIFPIGIGNSADMSVLEQFSPNRLPLKLKWLIQSVSIVSQSIPGDAVKLDIDGIKSWVDL